MPKILIADDNEEMLDTLGRIFTLYEFEVVKACDGKEAVEKAEKSIPDIVILDGMMPVMDGFEACQILKQQESTKDIPVVFLTANFMEIRDRLKGLELGADDYLLKPFNSKELVARIKTILSRTEQARKLKEVNSRLVYENSIIEKELKNVLQTQGSADNPNLNDPVTGLYHIEFFLDRVDNEIMRCKRFKQSMAFIVISFENFNKIKEILGSQLFNYIIIKLSNFILNNTRSIDVLSFNMEKGFYLLLPQTDYNGANAKIEKIKEALIKNQYIDKDVLNTLEFSKKKLSNISKLNFLFGVTSVDQNNPNIKALDLFIEAERAIKKTNIGK